MTPPASSTRVYSTSLWVELPPSIRPETDEDTLPPTPPTPPNRSSKCPDQYGSAMKPSQPTTSTPNRMRQAAQFGAADQDEHREHAQHHERRELVGRHASPRTARSARRAARPAGGGSVGSTSASPGRRFVQQHARRPEPDQQDRHERQVEEIGEALRGEVVLAHPAAEHEDPDAASTWPASSPASSARAGTSVPGRGVGWPVGHQRMHLGEVRDPAGLARRTRPPRRSPASSSARPGRVRRTRSGRCSPGTRGAARPSGTAARSRSPRAARAATPRSRAA